MDNSTPDTEEATNDGQPNHTHRGSGGRSSPDITITHKSLAKHAQWEIAEDLGSDHSAIILTVSVKKERKKRRSTKSWKKADWSKFSEVTEEIFDQEVMPASPHQVAEWFTKTLEKGDKAAVPTGLIQDPKPWWNQKVADAVKLRNSAKKKAHLGHKERREWNRSCRDATKIRLEERTASWEDFASELNIRTESRKITKTMNALEGKFQSGQNAALVVNGKKCTSEKLRNS